VGAKSPTEGLVRIAAGLASVRRCLYMAGLVVLQRNPVIQRFATAANAAYHAASARWVESCMDGVD
jgi:hypothetical protein